MKKKPGNAKKGRTSKPVAANSTEAEKAAQKETSVSTSKPRREHLQQLIDLVLAEATAKGWHAYTASTDESGFKYATVAVSRQAPDSYEEINGLFEITCSDRVRITYHKTSFYSWGLDDLYDAIRNEFYKLPWVKKSGKSATDSKSGYTDVVLIERLLRRFHRSVRQFKHRYNNRPALVIEDEYDVQDYLHAILRALFDDVRAEEYSPSYAGGASRMDFLLKFEQIVIEAKFAKNSLRDKQIGEELMTDILRYQAHPDCKRLFCLVYDPDGFVRNPIGLEADLSRVHNELEVKVVIVSP